MVLPTGAVVDPERSGVVLVVSSDAPASKVTVAAMLRTCNATVVVAVPPRPSETCTSMVESPAIVVWPLK
jgi:hypothetical protein